MSAIPSDKIVLNFAWRGPNIRNGGSSRSGLDVRVVDLLFKDIPTEISVSLPEDINPIAPQKFPFTCRECEEREIEYAGRRFKPLIKETHADSLDVSIEEIRDLTVRAGFFSKGSPVGPMFRDPVTGMFTRQETVRRTDRDVTLEKPEKLEIGQTYCLVVSSSADLSLSARFLKEEARSKEKDEKETRKEEFKRRARKMGEALVTEGIRNLKIASGEDMGPLSPTSTPADIYAHGMAGIIRAGREMHPGIAVPHSKPSESLSDLDKLSVDELQTRFEATFIRDKGFESQRLRAALAGDIPEMNRIIKVEHENSQLLINLAQTLERKGVTPKIPHSGNFQAAAMESTKLQAEALKSLQDQCRSM